MKVTILLVAMLALGGCVTETSSMQIRPAQGASAERSIEAFLITSATADFVSERCGAYGIRKNYSSSDQLVRNYVTGLQEEGYSNQELRRAMDRLSTDAITEKAIARLSARGVRPGDIGSLCRFGLNEISSGTVIGRLLRT